MGQKLYYSNVMFSRGRPNEIAPGTLHLREDNSETDSLLESEAIREATDAEAALWREINGTSEKPEKPAKPPKAEKPPKQETPAAPAPSPTPAPATGEAGAGEGGGAAGDDLVG